MCTPVPPNVPTHRVVFIGESAVGKTSIINRFIDGESGSPRSTVGADYTRRPLTINGKEIVLEIWDTAGAERYRSVGPLYYRNAHAAVAVFDLTVVQSLDALNFWISSYRENSAHPFVIIVGNKCDKRDIQFTLSQTEAAAEALHAEVLWTSALTGDRIDVIFELLGRHFLGEDDGPDDAIDHPTVPIGGEGRKRCC